MARSVASSKCCGCSLISRDASAASCPARACISRVSAISRCCIAQTDTIDVAMASAESSPAAPQAMRRVRRCWTRSSPTRSSFGRWWITAANVAIASCTRGSSRNADNGPATPLRSINNGSALKAPKSGCGNAEELSGLKSPAVSDQLSVPPVSTSNSRSTPCWRCQVSSSRCTQGDAAASGDARRMKYSDRPTADSMATDSGASGAKAVASRKMRSARRRYHAFVNLCSPFCSTVLSVASVFWLYEMNAL